MTTKNKKAKTAHDDATVLPWPVAWSPIRKEKSLQQQRKAEREETVREGCFGMEERKLLCKNWICSFFLLFLCLRMSCGWFINTCHVASYNTLNTSSLIIFRMIWINAVGTRLNMCACIVVLK